MTPNGVVLLFFSSVKGIALQVRATSSKAMQQQWEAHCHSISNKLTRAAESPLSQDSAILRGLAEQVWPLLFML